MMIIADFIKCKSQPESESKVWTAIANREEGEQEFVTIDKKQK